MSWEVVLFTGLLAYWFGNMHYWSHNLVSLLYLFISSKKKKVLSTAVDVFIILLLKLVEASHRQGGWDLIKRQQKIHNRRSVLGSPIWNIKVERLAQLSGEIRGYRRRGVEGRSRGILDSTLPLGYSFPMGPQKQTCHSAFITTTQTHPLLFG